MSFAHSLALRFVLFLLFLPACGPKPATATSQTVANSQRAPFLWAVERDGHVSHIFGTIHIGVSLHELPDIVGKRLDSSHTLIVEADTADLSSPSMLAKMVLPKGQSLRAMLGDKHWKILVHHMGDLYPPVVLDKLPPWMVQTVLSIEDPAALSKQPSLDSQLVARAEKHGKPVKFLETAEQQIDMLTRLIGVDDLRETLDDVPGARTSLRVLLRAYRNGNLAALTGLTLDPEEMAKNPQAIEMLLYERNRNWMDVLVRELSRGGVFVAVGAAHYVGRDGLLTLLDRAGFRVTRLDATGAPVQAHTTRHRSAYRLASASDFGIGGWFSPDPLRRGRALLPSARFSR